MPVLSRDPEEDVPECSGQEISRIFSVKIRLPGNDIGESRPLTTNHLNRKHVRYLDPTVLTFYSFDFQVKESVMMP